MLRIVVTAFLLAFILPSASQAQVKDSFYFMKDDGEFSPAEKDEEAAYIFNQCQSNPFQKIYFDCACIAGEFRNQRDAEDLIPQGELINNIVDNPPESCINTTVIAGDVYEECLAYSKVFRARAKNNEDYCSCAANRSALGFKDKPDLKLSNIEKIRSNAMVSCARIYKSPS
jgi:hypothetical protein